jgi:glycosyltransferase involved in cell wall biosynthesis
MGIDLRVSSLLGDDYLRQRFSGGALPLGSMLASGVRRLRELRAHDYDVAMLHCELFPLMPGWLERLLLGDTPYLYDFDDAFYLKYRSGRLLSLRPLLERKFDGVLLGAFAVTAGNATLADHAGRHNRSVTRFPTVVDTTRYVPGGSAKGDMFTVGWIGSPSTAPYLESLREPLQRMAALSPVKLVVIGGRAPSIAGVEVQELPWHEDTEVEQIRQFDVGVMPLPDTEWARGKCAFKLIQYMACGIPVVGSRVGANVDVVDPASGFLVSSDAEWLAALEALRDDRALAQSMGAAARERIEQHYSLQRNLPVLAELIHSAVRAGRA